MPEVSISIAGKNFQVACQPGEEAFLQSAAAVLDAEAAPLLAHSGRMPEARLLLMAGLLLADRMGGVEEQLRAALARIAMLEARPEPEPLRIETAVETRVEVPVLPKGLIERLAAIATDAETLADAAEQHAGDRADMLAG